jgi:hypothetical protein
MAVLAYLFLSVGSPQAQTATRSNHAPSQWAEASTPGGAAAAELPAVLVVLTEGEHAWQAAERRLLAELKTLRIRIVLLPGREDIDASLPDQVRRYRAIAGVQSLRYQDRGVVRVWLARSRFQRGGYRHVGVELRDADVLQAAVRPIYELLFAWVVQAQTPVAPVETKYAPRDIPLQNLDHGLMFGAGPWFSGGGTSPALNLTLRARTLFVSTISLEPELLLQAAQHEVGIDGERAGVRLLGMRVHGMFRPWPQASVMAGLGVGVGALLARASTSELKPETDWSPSVSIRGQMAAPVTRSTALVLALTAAWGMPVIALGDGQRVELDNPALDGMVGLEWQWE